MIDLLLLKHQIVRMPTIFLWGLSICYERDVAKNSSEVNINLQNRNNTGPSIICIPFSETALHWDLNISLMIWEIWTPCTALKINARVSFKRLSAWSELYKFDNFKFSKMKPILKIQKLRFSLRTFPDVTQLMRRSGLSLKPVFSSKVHVPFANLLCEAIKTCAKDNIKISERMGFTKDS